MQGIYQWTVERPGKLPLVYVGQAVDIKERKREHLSAWEGGGYHTNSHLKAAVLKYGNYEHNVLEEVEHEEDLTERERYWFWRRIEELGRENVANDIEPGRSPMSSLLTRERVAAANRTPEARSRSADALRERWSDGDYRAVMSEVVSKSWSDPDIRSRRIAGSAKTFEFCSPGGERVVVENLNAFCQAHGLNVGNMHSVHTGRLRYHKGWTRYEPS